jgi:MFS family permease
MPFIAALSDIFGRPVCLLTSLGLFTVGSVFCSVAHSLSLLLVGRCVQGIGGGGIIVLGFIIFTDIVPLRFRPKYFGIMCVFFHGH